MPRTARKISRSNIYHVILRGINRQTIFEDDGDRHYFMTVLQYYKGISGYKLHAFCLMGNHVHLLIEPAGEPLGQIFKRVGVRYVNWYNRKYERSGHLFQDRFRSENVDSEQYYRTVLRYILQNPMKAGLERQPGSWRWSSYLAYRKGAGSITDTQYALDLFGGRDALIRFVLQGNDDLVMDEESYDPRFREDRPKRIMKRITNCENASAFQQLERKIGIDPATVAPYEPIEFEVSGDKIQAVHMLPGYTHNIINLSETENLVTVMWANEIFDPRHPDTFFEKV